MCIVCLVTAECAFKPPRSSQLGNICGCPKLSQVALPMCCTFYSNRVQSEPHVSTQPCNSNIRKCRVDMDDRHKGDETGSIILQVNVHSTADHSTAELCIGSAPANSCKEAVATAVHSQHDPSTSNCESLQPTYSQSKMMGHLEVRLEHLENLDSMFGKML